MGLSNKEQDTAAAVMRALPKSDKRIIVALAGPPAVGKSTLAERLVKLLNKDDASTADLLPMDGFHLDNSILKSEGSLDRKGAPETFDFDGLHSLLERVRDEGKDHFIPTFDRSRDIAIAGSSRVRKKTKVLIVEGNYLLLAREPWSELALCFDHTVFLEASVEELKRRLSKRWLDHGYSQEDANRKSEHNDIPNAMLVLENRRHADQTFSQ